MHPGSRVARIQAGLGLAAILALALGVRLIRLDHSGFTTPYYAAAVRSMAGDWHDFLFAAFDPAGFLAVDKPPVALWVQALAARLFGFGGAALHLPQVAEGVAGVALLHHLVARRFGAGAGLLAALFLAITPLSVAVDRSNNTDACLVLVMLLAAWPLAVAAERSSLSLLLLAAALLGVGFDVKMLAAMVVVPGFFAVYWFGAPAPWRRRIGHLAAAGLVLGAVSLSWPMLCDLTPPDQRPYVDSTQENSVLELAIGHNAMDRFIRPAWRRGWVRETRPLDNAAAASPRAIGGVPAGVFRLADPLLASQVLWLLPLAAAGLLVGATGFGGRGRGLRLPLDPAGQAVLLWGGWLLVPAIVYSAAGGIFQPYYLAPLAPPVAALAAIGLMRPRSAALRLAALAVTAVWQATILCEAIPAENPLIWLVAAPVIGVLLAASVELVRQDWAPFAFAICLAGLLAAPSAWVAGTIAGQGGAGGGAPLASLIPRPRLPGARLASLADDAMLMAYLNENRGTAHYLLATPSARLAAPLIVRTGLPVMAMGGFIGSIPSLTREDLADLAATGALRFVMLTGTRQAAGPQALEAWVRANGREVSPALWRGRAPVRAAARQGAGAARLQLFDLAAQVE